MGGREKKRAVLNYSKMDATQPTEFSVRFYVQ